MSCGDEYGKILEEPNKLKRIGKFHETHMVKTRSQRTCVVVFSERRDIVQEGVGEMASSLCIFRKPESHEVGSEPKHNNFVNYGAVILHSI